MPFVPQATLNAIGRPLMDASNAEIGQLASERQKRLQAVLNARGMIGSGVELGNIQEMERNRAQLEQQALQSALNKQNDLGFQDFNRQQSDKVNAILSLLESTQKGQLTEAQLNSQKRLAEMDAQSKAQLQSQALAAAQEQARVEAELKGQLQSQGSQQELARQQQIAQLQAQYQQEQQAREQGFQSQFATQQSTLQQQAQAAASARELANQQALSELQARLTGEQKTKEQEFQSRYLTQQTTLEQQMKEALMGKESGYQRSWQGAGESQAQQKEKSSNTRCNFSTAVRPRSQMRRRLQIGHYRATAAWCSRRSLMRNKRRKPRVPNRCITKSARGTADERRLMGKESDSAI